MAQRGGALLLLGGLFAALAAAFSAGRGGSTTNGGGGQGGSGGGGEPPPPGGSGGGGEPPPPGGDWMLELGRELELAGVRNFTAKELTWMPKAKPVPYADEPPREYWPNLVAVAVQAQELRDRLGLPLSVSSAWRPKWYNDAVGGASNSAHIRGAAIDLNLLPGDRTKANEDRIRLAAARLWLNHPGQLAGLGFYKSPIGRVHLDALHPGGQGRRYWDHALVDPYLKLIQGEA